MVEEKKIKILALCDSPTSATGFAQVARNILNRLAKTGKYHIDVIGINYYGDYYDREKYPYNIYPAMPQGWQEMYGRDRFLSVLGGNQVKNGLIPPWDIIFTIQDPFIIEGLGTKIKFGDQLRVTAEMWKRVVPVENWFRWIGYFPVDSTLKENWVDRSIALPHRPVAYCNYGKNEILKFDKKEFKIPFNLHIKEEDDKIQGLIKVESLRKRIKVIHHGVDLSVFKPLPKKDIKEFRKTYFGGRVKDDTFLVVNISRNQPRKDIPRTLKAFSMFKKIVPNAYLYLHMKEHDAGGSVTEMARQFGLAEVVDFTVPDNFDSGTGFSIDVVNKIYNAADLCLTTTLGEGWGFITSEAMATKTPIVAPNITSIVDIFNTGGKNYSVKDLDIGKNSLRGIPVNAGTTSSEWVCLGIEDNERVRPLTNVDDLVLKMVWAYANPEKVAEIVDRGYEWVQDQSWEAIVDQWEELFTTEYKILEQERALAERFDKVGRNDPCPCGSGSKYKKCHGAKTGRNKFSDWITDMEKEVKEQAKA